MDKTASVSSVAALQVAICLMAQGRSWQSFSTVDLTDSRPCFPLDLSRQPSMHVRYTVHVSCYCFSLLLAVHPSQPQSTSKCWGWPCITRLWHGKCAERIQTKIAADPNHKPAWSTCSQVTATDVCVTLLLHAGCCASESLQWLLGWPIYSSPCLSKVSDSQHSPSLCDVRQSTVTKQQTILQTNSPATILFDHDFD